ncbi:MAG: hypothetical protein A3F47_02130 [Candidatus Staskawiczbacteria bacterium RIFCSPHIGHO2_12_FULL_38_11]|uniref:NYN domain-containing protein n=1 Tax=Candidatus Staskawiczbacteria bacterium RIFCSPHIGHO2_12_FULL_38_11 TaxID=1802209 RepID=A0A1G2I3S7_9BACT|nr:MAG: hypothetical protein A3F47_02130 [Candidatus Staskawiczbacteria bacterium RIFCSPHIGHO2_12_FULL_38_11]
MSNNIVFVVDWSNLDRGQRDNFYKVGEYNKEAGFDGLDEFLFGIGKVTRRYMYTPLHDVYGHFEFLRDRGFTIVLCPIIASTSTDTTDAKLMQDVLDLIENYNMQYLCIGSGDGHFMPILEAAKQKGIKVAVVYGSERSLSRQIREMADEYPKNHPKAGEKMLHLFSPTNKKFEQQQPG